MPKILMSLIDTRNGFYGVWVSYSESLGKISLLKREKFGSSEIIIGKDSVELIETVRGINGKDFGTKREISLNDIREALDLKRKIELNSIMINAKLLLVKIKNEYARELL